MTIPRPGSLATVHGSNPENALRRLDLLCQRANVPSQVELIAAAVQLVVEIRRETHVRPRVVDIARVEGLDSHGNFVLRSFHQDAPSRLQLILDLPTGQASPDPQPPARERTA